jgi:hypothetical protein
MDVIAMIFSNRHNKLSSFLQLFLTHTTQSQRLAQLLEQTIVCWEADEILNNFPSPHSNPSQDEISQSELVAHCVDMLVIKSTANILAYGYRKLTMKSTTSCARSENFFPNSHVSYITKPVFLLDDRFGRNC